MTNFVKPNISAINRIIYYSILIRDIRLTLLQTRKTMLMIRGLRVTVPSFEDLREVEMALIRRMNEVMQSCRLLISPLFENIDFGHRYLDHWALSMYDIKRGYSELEEILQYSDNKPKQFGRKYILLLEDYTDPTLGTFYGGELIPLEKAIHFINNIPEKKDKRKGLYDAMVDTLNTAMLFRKSNII